MFRTGRFVAAVVAVLFIGALALAAPPAKPTIDDLVGTWQLAGSGFVHDLSTGAKKPDRAAAVWQITKVSGTVVNIHETHDDPADTYDYQAYYANGILYWGAGDDPNLATACECTFAEVKGKAPRLTLVGGSHLAYDNSPSENELMSFKFTAKKKVIK